MGKGHCGGGTVIAIARQGGGGLGQGSEAARRGNGDDGWWLAVVRERWVGNKFWDVLR